MTISKLYTKCEKCKLKDSCTEKRMMACATYNNTGQVQASNNNMSTKSNAYTLVGEIKVNLTQEFNKSLEHYFTNRGAK